MTNLPLRATLRLFLMTAPMLMGIGLQGQSPTPAPTSPPAAPAATEPSFPQPDFGQQEVLKRIDDLLWYQKLGDIAEIDKVTYASLPPAHVAHPKLPGATNPLLVHAYTFIPKNLDRSRKQPLIVYVHQGIHQSLDTSLDAHPIRELLEQGYTIVATDYRGSTGYGRGFYEDIDYGGRETDDVYLGMQWMLQRYSLLDPKRVGIVGWSHGGMITLMNIFAHPKDYAVAYAGVPVSDLIARMGYEPPAYQALYSAPYHLGETAHQDIQRNMRNARRSSMPTSWRHPC